LQGADLRGANLTGASLTRATYDESTHWPEGFWPRLRGCIYRKRPSEIVPALASTGRGDEPTPSS
jgi:hypothetical protein